LFIEFQTNRDSIVKQLDELYQNDRLPETLIFLFTEINQPHVNLEMKQSQTN